MLPTWPNRQRARSETLSDSSRTDTSRKYLLTLSLGALGVVYGDIGTSPLYALRECFHGPHAIPLNRVSVLGVLSLIVWSLLLVISLKYLVFVMRADNRGEGGILALLALIGPHGGGGGKRRWLLVLMGLFGAALLYGDGIITPAITVLSAVEGLQVATPLFAPYVIPITIVILIILFVVQKRGTGGIGAVFGPLILIWLAVLAALGIYQIAQQPGVLVAMNPMYAVRLWQAGGWHAFLILGTVFLVVTGGEALYADMGHFGAKPIRLAWFSVVLPALILNYFGQGALLIRDPSAAENPFFNMSPSWALYPLVILATAAASVASQAVISGAFSLTRQAVQLGYMPRVEIDHTSAREIGQIYIPAINYGLMIACIALVIGFGTSSNLAAAYGVAVTTTMVITTILLFVLAREKWGWSLAKAGALTLFFMVIDLAFFAANIIKVPDGGWFPLLVAALVMLLMTTWRRGREILNDRLREGSLSQELFLSSVAARPPIRVPGTAIFMFRNPEGTPTALLHNLKHNKVLHERVILMTIETSEIPHVPAEERVSVEPMGHGIHRMVLRYGFMEDPDVPAVMAETKAGGEGFEESQTTYFLGRETLVITGRPGMAIWREKLFSWMSRNASGASFFFRLPPNRVVELGAQIEF